MIDTTGWNEYPFTVNGIQFISKAKPGSSMGLRFESIPREVLDGINTSCVLDIIGENVHELSREYLISLLEIVNTNGTEAVVELAN